ncbi:MAG: hypothetical protein ACM31N_07675 [Deltaproteobacteria bacterium]
MPKRKNLSAIKIPANWETAVKRHLQTSIRDNPEKLREALQILKPKPVKEGVDTHLIDDFATVALREYLVACADGCDNDLKDFADIIGMCADIKIIAGKRYPNKYFSDLAAAIRLIRREDVPLLNPDAEEVGYCIYIYEQWAKEKGKPGRKPPAPDMFIKRLSHRLENRFGRPCDEIVASLLRAMYPEKEYDASYVAERRRRLKNRRY